MSWLIPTLITIACIALAHFIVRRWRNNREVVPLDPIEKAIVWICAALLSGAAWRWWWLA